MKKFFVFIVFLGLPFLNRATVYQMNENCLQAYRLILSLRFQEAETFLKAEKIAHPENNIVDYLENYQWFLKVIISEDENVFKSEANARQHRLDRFEMGNPDSPWHLYCQAQLNMQWAFARLKFGQFATAALEFNRAYRQLLKNQKLFPSFLPNKTALGLMHVLIGSIPDGYKWIAKAVSVEGTVNEGVAELRQVMRLSEEKTLFPFLQTETLFMYTFITFNMASSTENMAVLEGYLSKTEMKAQIQSNPLLTYAASSYFLHTGKNAHALEILMNRQKSNLYYPFYYLDYLTGVAMLNKLDFGARLYFLRYIYHFKGASFIKSACQRIAWIGLLNNDVKEYQAYMERVKLLGRKEIDGDKQAMFEANQKAPPDVNLLKARLLFDGGYYQRAASLLEAISKNDFIAAREKLEYTYRLGRIYDAWGIPEKAIPYYKLTIADGADKSWYFAANSALHLGMIYEAAGNLKDAINCYERCLSMDFKEYNFSITQKARAGLNRLK